MKSIYITEFILFLLNILIYLFPIIKSLKKKSFSFIYPHFMISFFIVINISVALFQRWFNLFNSEVPYALRHTARLYMNDNFYITPLLLSLLGGLFLNLGVKAGCGNNYSDEKDLIHIRTSYPILNYISIKILFLMSLFLIAIASLPFLIFGQSRGYFWTAALIYASYFIPMLIVKKSISFGTIIFFLGFIIPGIRGSKGDFIYYLMPTLFFNQDLIKKAKNKIFIVIALCAAFLIVITGTKNLIYLRIGGSNQENIIDNILKREYGFEIFAIAVSEESPINLFRSDSWLLYEMKETLPSFILHNKPEMGKIVAMTYLPVDYRLNPLAGYNRFYLLHFYHDLGVLGIIIGAFFIGFILSRIYEYLRIRALEINDISILAYYVPFVVYAELIAAGVYAYAIIHILCADIIIFCLINFSKILTKLNKGL